MVFVVSLLRLPKGILNHQVESRSQPISREESGNIVPSKTTSLCCEPMRKVSSAKEPPVAKLSFNAIHHTYFIMT